VPPAAQRNAVRPSLLAGGELFRHRGAGQRIGNASRARGCQKRIAVTPEAKEDPRGRT